MLASVGCSAVTGMVGFLNAILPVQKGTQFGVCAASQPSVIGGSGLSRVMAVGDAQASTGTG